jgi:hypothetical protein
MRLRVRIPEELEYCRCELRCAEDRSDGPRVNPALPDPVRGGLLGRPGRQRDSVGDGGQYPAVPGGPVALGIESIKALTPHDRMSLAGRCGLLRDRQHAG